MTHVESAIEESLLNVADPIQFAAQEYWCAMKVLDTLGVPRQAVGGELSLAGRIYLAAGKMLNEQHKER